MSNILIAPDYHTVSAWNDGASLFVQNTLCFNTRRDYAAETRLFAAWVGKPAHAIMLGDLLSYREHLEARNLKTATVAKKLTVLRRLFCFLFEQGLIERNPSAGLKLPKINDESSRDVLTVEECHRLLSVIDPRTLRGKRDKSIIALMLLNGLRCCEIARANIEDLRKTEECWVLKVHGKGGKEADTRVRDDCLVVIQAYIAARGEVAPSSPLFLGTTHRSGMRLTTRTIQHAVKKYLRRAGIVRVGLVVHSLRHSAITHVILSGASLLAAQEFARHKSPVTTQRYVHNHEKLKKHAVLLHPVHIN